MFTLCGLTQIICYMLLKTHTHTPKTYTHTQKDQLTWNIPIFWHFNFWRNAGVFCSQKFIPKEGRRTLSFPPFGMQYTSAFL